LRRLTNLTRLFRVLEVSGLAQGEGMGGLRALKDIQQTIPAFRGLLVAALLLPALALSAIERLEGYYTR
jgi:hypothetical protein